MKKLNSCVKNALIFLFLTIFGLSLTHGENLSKNVKIKITGQESKENPVHLTLASKESKIIGNIKITTMNLIVANESDRILEGELEFPLAEGESVIGYAIDVNGKLRQGVVVEKDKGRQVFDSIVRQGIDPGLIEKTNGNNFKTRIYPIPAKGLRQVQIVVQGGVKEKSERKEGLFAETIGKDTFFYYNQPLSASERLKKLPKNLTVCWDISSSGENRNLTAEIDFLKAYIKKLDSPTVAFYPFANEIHAGHVFEIKSDKNLSDLEAFIKNLQYDGATNLGYDWRNFGGEEILVFTDGLGNWSDGKAEVGNAGVGALVYTINSSSSADHAWLSSLAQKNGGLYVNLSENVKIEEKLSLMLAEPYRLIRAEYDSKAVGELYPEEGSPVSGDFNLTGLLKKKSAQVKLYFGHGNSIEESVTVKVSASDGIESDYVARQWASEKIAALSKNYDKNKEEIISLAKKFSVVTKDTSLIVLENASDYARYGIHPPKDDKDLCSEYEKIIARQGNSNVKPVNSSSKHEILKSVYETFKEFKKWWNTSLEEFKKIKENNDKGGIIRPLRAMQLMEAAPAGIEGQTPPVYSDMANVVGQSRTQSLSREAAPMAEKSLGGENSSSAEAKIFLQAWSPDADYLKILKKTATEKMYEKYLELKKSYGSSPAFYMEVSDYFAEEDLESQSLRILSNLAELNLENTDLLRALANKLVERKKYALAIPVFEKLVALKGEIPQFYRDLGMAYYMAGEAQKAVDTLYSLVYKKWDRRFEQVQQIALNDMNAIIADCQRKKIKLDTSEIDKKLMENFDVDVRVILTWNTDDCDVDLWVTDCDGEKCFYGNPITRKGGRMSWDFTQGYGPEEFCIKTAPGGKLKIEANYFGNHQQKVLQPVTVQAEVYTNFGRANQKREVLTLQLNDVKGTFLIGEVEL
ncbi:MAG: DUF2135 domain-containing protein [Treponema sp.]|uniref:VIT domain-containing protein n=1 Tax=Treponema sp. TaxID=166 RepID=UPI0025E6F5DF|nr:VIT domain-containing protein [Treponema sp.]MBQ8679762.1 DUF2135 domain-containing protein [Treponema sp.]